MSCSRTIGHALARDRTDDLGITSFSSLAQFAPTNEDCEDANTLANIVFYQYCFSSIYFRFQSSHKSKPWVSSVTAALSLACSSEASPNHHLLSPHPPPPPPTCLTPDRTTSPPAAHKHPQLVSSQFPPHARASPLTDCGCLQRR